MVTLLNLDLLEYGFENAKEFCKMATHTTRGLISRWPGQFCVVSYSVSENYVIPIQVRIAFVYFYAYFELITCDNVF